MGGLQCPDKWSGFSGMASSAHWSSNLFLEVRGNFEANGGMTRFRQMVRNCRNGVIRPLDFKCLFEIRVKFEDQWGYYKVPTNGQDLSGWRHPPISLHICFLTGVENWKANGGMTRSRQMLRICRDGVIRTLAFKFVF